jgi:hypothetical protein
MRQLDRAVKRDGEMIALPVCGRKEFWPSMTWGGEGFIRGHGAIAKSLRPAWCAANFPLQANPGEIFRVPLLGIVFG